MICLCLWLLSYSNGTNTHTHTHTHTGIKEKLVNMEIVSILVQVMKGTTKDKVIRMIVANVLLMCC